MRCRVEEAGRHIECSVYESAEMQAFFDYVLEPSVPLESASAVRAEECGRAVEDAYKEKLAKAERAVVADPRWDGAVTTLGDILRQLHLAVENVVSAEHQASEDYARELRNEVVYVTLPRVIEMLKERER